MKSLFTALIVIVSLHAVCVVQCYSMGNCPRHAPIRDFNRTKFLGHWYEVERSFHLVELLSTCTTIDLRQQVNRPHINVTVRTLNKWTGSVTRIDGTAQVSRRHPSVFLFKRTTTLWPNAIAKLLPGVGVYQIVSTDYDHYAVLWTCTQTLFGLAYNDFIWIFGRHVDLNAHLRLHIYDTLKSLNIDAERFTLANKNCTLIAMAVT